MLNGRKVKPYVTIPYHPLNQVKRRMVKVSDIDGGIFVPSVCVCVFFWGGVNMGSALTMVTRARIICCGLPTHTLSLHLCNFNSYH